MINTPLTKVEYSKKPFICAGDISICLNKEFNALEDVIAYDSLDGDLSSKVKVIKNTVNVSKVENYEVIYEVTNSRKQTSNLKVEICVINCKNCLCEDIIEYIKCISKIQKLLAKLIHLKAKQLELYLNCTNLNIEKILCINLKIDCFLKIVIQIEAELISLFEQLVKIYQKHCINLS